MHDKEQEEEEQDGAPKGLRIKWDVNITTVLVLIGAVGSAMFFVATTRTAADTANTNNIRLEQEIRLLQASVNSGLERVTTQLATLPDQRARLDEEERHMTDVDRWRAVVETRLNDVRDRQAEVRSDVDNLIRASAMSLTPTRARR